MPSFVQDDSIDAAALLTLRGSRHSVVFAADDPLLPLLRRSCPFIVFSAEADGRFSVAGSSFLRVLSAGYRLRGDILDHDPATASLQPEALGRILSRHYADGLDPVQCAIFGEWKELLMHHTVQMLATQHAANYALTTVDEYHHEPLPADHQHAGNAVPGWLAGFTHGMR